MMKQAEEYSDIQKAMILDLLKSKEDYVSGQLLAKTLKVSRQALHKHMVKLGQKGYDIEACPRLGYKLESWPDKLYPWEIQSRLSTRLIGKKIFHSQMVDSTQDVAWGLGLRGFEDGLLVVSEQQRKGRGRLGRRWISNEGGVYFSLLLRPDFLALDEVSQITLMASLGCIKGIRKACGIQCSLKWPNDVMFENKKVGGVLCEMNAESDRVNFVIVGIGLNVNLDKKKLPSEASSLRVIKNSGHIDRIKLISAVLEEIENCYFLLKQKDFSSMRKSWQKHCCFIGKMVNVNVWDEVVRGRALRIDDKGHLILRLASGRNQVVSAGDVTLKRKPHKI